MYDRNQNVVKVEFEGMTRGQAAAAILRYLRHPNVSILDPEVRFEIRAAEGATGLVRVSSDYYVDGATLSQALLEKAKELDPAAAGREFASAHVDSFD